MSSYGFLGCSAGKESTCNAGDLGSIPGSGRSSPGEGKGYPLQYSGLENSMECIARGVAKSQTRLSDSHSHDGYVTNITTFRYGDTPALHRLTQSHLFLARKWERHGRSQRDEKRGKDSGSGCWFENRGGYMARHTQRAMRSSEGRGCWPTVSKEMGNSVLQPEGAKFCQSPGRGFFL